MSSESDQSKATLARGALGEVLRLLTRVSRRRKWQVALLFGVMLASAFAEVLSLGAVLPFIAILAAPEKALGYPGVSQAVAALGLDPAGDLTFALTAIFVVAALVAGALRLFVLWLNTRLSFSIGADFSVEVYRRTLYQPYQVHVARNSSEVISGITQKVWIGSGVLLGLLQLVSSLVILAAVMLALLAIHPLMAIAAAAGFGAAYGAIAWLSRRQLARNSERIAREQVQIVRSLQEGLGGIRDVLLDGTQSVFVDVYRRADEPLRQAYASNSFVAQSPRPAMEACGIALVAALAYGFSRQPGGLNEVLPLLAALVLGAQRLLPTLQQIYSAWANIAGHAEPIRDLIQLLDQPLPEDASRPAPEPLAFNDSIRLEDVRFRYRAEGPWVLDGFDLAIPKGSRVGFVGSTGSGKSTLLDLLMLLLHPVQGRILVDGQPVAGERRRAWQRSIAHVPQAIYLSDTTFAENIAFGVRPGDIDADRVRQVARQAQIADFIESRPEGYQGLVGERGVRLSGGQRQRIGIARALYKRAGVLVFDEATSALDNATEQGVMEAIDGLERDLTLLIIAHRLTTVQRCDVVVQLEQGRIVAQGTYEELLERSPSFRRMAAAV